MITAFMRWLYVARNDQFDDYHALWSWSVEEPATFWEALWEYAQIDSPTPYHTVLEDHGMPNVRWFPGAQVNYAGQMRKGAVPGKPAILFQSERTPQTAWSWAQVDEQVAAVQEWLTGLGLRQGDRVVAFLPNIPEATIAFMAVSGLGLVWSACSPDFGAASVIDRFAQIEPKALITVDGYQYNGKPFNKMDVVATLVQGLPTLKGVAMIPYLDAQAELNASVPVTKWMDLKALAAPRFIPVPFEHPLWVLYSSGTTGKPKAITHSHGGSMMEHYKYLWMHNDVHPGEKFFWYSTTGWMMWNFVQASMLAGATIVLYDGSPSYPDMGVLWRLAESAGIHHFGTSAPYILACMKAEMRPGAIADLSALRSIGSTGSPLPPEGFDYVYDAIGRHIWLCSMSGGTDVCSAFVGGCPLLPVYQGEIQCRTLGCALYAYDDHAIPVNEAMGEMVITKPMPSMPVYFWNDPDGKKYRGSYFEDFPGVWRHGDFIRITDRGGVVIYGRSDATLNRHGIRIGTAEIYSVLDQIEGVRDALIMNIEMEGGRHYMPLFIVLEEGFSLNEDLIAAIQQKLKTTYSPRHVPDEILTCPDIPYTISGKKLEAPIKKLLMGIPPEKAITRDALRNPEAVKFFEEFAQSFLKGKN